MIYFVDIDETICHTPLFTDGSPNYAESTPCYGNITIVNSLYDQGHRIVYWTSRGAKTGLDWRELTKQQLHRWGCKHHELRLDKPFYDVLFDDKARSLPAVGDSG